MQFKTWRLSPRWAMATIASAGATTAVSIVVPSLVGAVVEDLSRGSRPSLPLARLAAALVFAAVIGTVASLCGGVYSVKVTRLLRSRAIESVTRRDVDAPLSTGDLATRLLVDATKPASGLGIGISVSLSGVVLVSALGAIAIIDWWVLLGLIAGLLGLVAMVRRFVADTTPLVEAYRAGQSQIADRALDAQRGAASIQAHGIWRAETARILAPLTSVRSAGLSLWSIQARLAWRAGVFAPGIALLIVSVGGASLWQGRITVGDLASLLGYSGLVIGALDGVEAAAGLPAVRVGVRRIQEMIGRTTFSSTGSVQIPPGPVAIDVIDVSVTDADGGLVLRRQSLCAPAGSYTAIVGAERPSAALAQVSAGVVRAFGGQVRVGGHPGADLASDAHVVALASARPPLIGDTVIDLMMLGLPAADPQDARHAARQARIDDVIMGLPNGYDTPLVDLELSGGELQRIGLAQALLHGAGALVMQDATSSLDPATELEVLRAVIGSRRERTVIVASARRSLIDAADEVCHLPDCMPDADDADDAGFATHALGRVR